jgi:hypothetical protein
MDIQVLLLLVSRDILPFILLDIRPGFGLSCLPRRAAVASLRTNNRVNVYTPPGEGPTRRAGDGASAPQGRSGPGDGATWLVGARLRSDGAAGLVRTRRRSKTALWPEAAPAPGP